MALIRPAEIADLPAITDIYNALVDTTTHEWTETHHTIGERRSWFARQRRSEHPVLVAVVGGNVVGWATYGDFRDSRRWPGYRFTVEHTIHVAVSHWGRGVGRALIDGLVDDARRAGKRVMVAGIDGANEGSIAFHARLGFQTVGHMPGIGDKWGRRLDLVLMQREIAPPSPS